MKVFGPLENASIESLSTLPTTAVAGRFYINANTNNVEVDDGANKRALLRNDGRAVIGTDATASNNVRFHHAGQSLLQFVVGNDQTAENASSNTLAMVGLRASNMAADPTAGNIGRLYYNTATNGLKVETASGFLQFASLTGQETLSNKTLSAASFDVLSGQDQTGTPSTPANGTKIYTKAGSLYKISTDGVESIVGAGGNTQNFVTKTASYTAAATDGVAFISASGGAVTVTLPSASANSGVRLSFQKTDTTLNAITLGTIGAVMTSQNENITILSNGSAWVVINRIVWPYWIASYYYGSTSASIPANTPIKWDTKRDDTNNSFNTATGVLTVPFSGRMRVTTSNQTTSGNANLYLRRTSGTAVNVNFLVDSGLSKQPGTTVISVIAGETYVIQGDSAIAFGGASTAYGQTAEVVFERVI